MEVGELISLYRRQSGMTIDELVEKSGVPKGTLTKIIGGVTKAPTLNNMKAIAAALGKRLSDFDNDPEIADMFSPSERAHIKKYRLLAPDWKEAVDSITDIGYRRCLSALKEKQRKEPTETAEELAPETVYFTVPCYESPMSAGTGQLAGDGLAEDYRLIKAPPRGTSYIAPVCGDSMEPTFRDGDRLFIHSTVDIRPGQIGVFFMDGQQWVKELGNGVLLSHNKKYAPVHFTEDVQCQGLVLGVCDDSYFE